MGLRKFGAGDILNTDPKKKTAAKKQLTPEEAAAIRTRAMSHGSTRLGHDLERHPVPTLD